MRITFCVRSLVTMRARWKWKEASEISLALSLRWCVSLPRNQFTFSFVFCWIAGGWADCFLISSNPM